MKKLHVYLARGAQILIVKRRAKTALLPPLIWYEVKNMSPKELLYIEDALGHTQYLMTQCRTAASQLTDPGLRGEAQRMVAEHQKLFASFYNLV